MTMLNLKRIGNHDLPLPAQKTLGAAGFDLSAAHCATIYPGQRVTIRTGFAWAIPVGMAGFVWPRSGLAVKDWLDTLAGVIDSDFRGELGVVLINHGERPVTIAPGDRIAQLVIGMHLTATAFEVEELDATERGAGGYGSTGVSA